MSTPFDHLARWALGICSDRQLYAELRRRRRREQRLAAMRRHPSSGAVEGPWNVRKIR